MKKSAPRVQVISRLASLTITVALNGTVWVGLGLIAVDERKNDARTVRAKSFSVDDELRIGQGASILAVLIELSFPQQTASLIGSAAAASGDRTRRVPNWIQMECAALGSMRQ
jgi:hypothetical protein